MALAMYPALDDSGWLTEINQVLDAVVSDFYMAEYSQDYVFARSVTSFPKILEENNGDIDNIAIATRAQLTQLLLKYFEDAQVEASKMPDSSEMRGLMMLSVTVTRGKETTSLRNLLRINNTRLEAVRKILDGE